MLNNLMNKHYDLSFLKDYFDDDMESIVPILKLYLEETPKELANIESALLKNDAATAKAVTHKIKTNVAMLGILDAGTFINDMHLHLAGDDVNAALIRSFQKFKEAVEQGLVAIQHDFAEK